MSEGEHKNRLVRFRELFEKLIELPIEKHSSFLNEHCEKDPEMRQELLSLIQQTQSTGNKVDALGEELVEPERESVRRAMHGPAEQSGTQFANYTLIEPIGEGGFGTVWLAEQSQPVRRRVALKIIKLGMDTREVVARFEAERQALAMMTHPNIATVFDAGATDTGRPYFVMEYVEGIPITSFCRKHHLSLKTRLKLFIDVCHAVQHAHQKGVIHRDIKPSNILVSMQDDQPVPKIIDFGISKATQQQLTDKTVFTQIHSFIGTPVYTSPEQMDTGGIDIDTRSDIYSLGIVLYELLTGRPPFDPTELAKAGFEAMCRILKEEDPRRPSTQLKTLSEKEQSSIAREYQINPVQLSSALHGDLDWIVMHCIEKDRARRYETANGLLQDIERFLHNEPITAHPPSSIYNAQKFLIRHRRMVASFVAMALILIVGTVTSVWQAVRATRAEQQTAIAMENEVEAREEAEAVLLEAHSKGLVDGNNTYSLAHSIAGLERQDTPERRRLALQALWEAPVFFQLNPMQGYSPSGYAEFTPDGEWLITCGTGPEVLLWPSDGGAPEIMKTGDEEYVPETLKLSPSKKLLLVDYSLPDSGSFVGPFKQVLWDMSSRKPIKEWPIENWAPQWFNKDETKLLAYSLEKKTPYPGVGWWSIEEETITPIGSPHEEPPAPIRYPTVFVWNFFYPPSDNLDWLASWKDNEVFVTPIGETSLGDPIWVGKQDADIKSVSISANGNFISSGDDKKMIIWSRQNPGEELLRLATGNGGGKFDLLESQILAGWPPIGGSLNMYVSYDFRGPPGSNNQPFLPSRGSPTGAAVSPDKNWFVVTGADRRWTSVFNMRAIRPFHVDIGMEDEIALNSIQMSPDLTKVAYIVRDGEVILVDLTLPDFPKQVVFKSPEKLMMINLLFDPTGKSLLVCTHQEGAWLVPLEKGEPILLEEAPSYSGHSAFSPSGNLFAVSGGEADIPASERFPRIFDRTGRLVAKVQENTEEKVNDLAFLSENELLIATASALKLWNFQLNETRIIKEGLHGMISLSQNYFLVEGEASQWLYDRKSLESQKLAVGRVIAPNEEFVVDIDPQGSLLVQYLDEDRYHLLPREMGIGDWWIDPDGYWMAIIDFSGKLSYWPIPRGEPLHDRPIEEFLEILKAQTNVRVVFDPQDEKGYRYEFEPFPGWETNNTWQEWYSPEYMENIVWKPQLDLEALGITPEENR